MRTVIVDRVVPVLSREGVQWLHIKKEERKRKKVNKVGSTGSEKCN